MLYERSLEIERRLEAVLGMIRQGRYSTPRMAEELGVSVPTVSRDVTALRQRGHDIRAERGESGWRYVLHDSPDLTRALTSHRAEKSRRNPGTPPA